eukprot:CAMPEP_0185621122 /NCGR_PEP_ID=MMETSP0436-20130131/56289_1 /TAXON_ID=626734 ORGANISM="Favella taraikaensis, Strain Fe Narragansett Bay" /NCGR_SAMPLE_ID=MMETSP0436 /ASSEMBLY_ACC=CAM_ASM_000390 /LENGTH=67 /DNA_ID=CAMNT_0028262091 /DNA_START=240 /DNA_END=440 /DNA_ORIENTATION=-
MPEMDGPQVARAVRKILEREVVVSERPFICCCTAYSEPTFVKEALAAGMDEFLTKPISNNELKTCLA